MHVKNHGCIRRLSFKTLWASRKRNVIAIIAIALTTILFTSLFTVALSINTSAQEYTFRQIGGYSHGTFKEVNEEQIAAISAHPDVKAFGVRTAIGMAYTDVFAKVPGEISYMDANCTKWSYAVPTVGRMPEQGMEIAMDIGALQLLGVEPTLGAEVTLTYQVSDLSDYEFTQTDCFTLVGWWEYDTISPVHYLNVSQDYAAAMAAETERRGCGIFRTDMNVMMASSFDIERQMEQVNTDLGYTWDQRGAENNVRIGVNWGYTGEQLLSILDGQMLLSMAAFLLLIVFTGYLIIYNIFQISVTGDIRFYGLLKTIGVTPRQLKRIIGWQALMLCAFGIPIGLAVGYGIGALLVPVAMESTVYANTAAVSSSPLIFVGAVLFSLGTVLLSCARPGCMAAKVSPIEAAKYTEVQPKGKKPKHRTRRSGDKAYQMAWANLGRSRLKTLLVVVSLTLSVVLLNVLVMFVSGFDTEKYLEYSTSADFIVSNPGYFRSINAEEYISPEDLAAIQANTNASFSGIGYDHDGIRPIVYMPEAAWRADVNYYGQNDIDQLLTTRQRKGDLVGESSLLMSYDTALFDKMHVVEGDLEPLLQEGSNAIAMSVYTDDYGNVSNREYYPAVGDSLIVTYVDNVHYVDSRTGEPVNDATPAEYYQEVLDASHDVTYTVCALVDVPHSMGYRYATLGYEIVLPAERMEADSGQRAVPMFYLFDTPDALTEAEAEAYLAELCADDLLPLMYESKATKRAEFKNYQMTYLMLGGVLCAIVGVIGVLNFCNAIMTGILSRRREFAVLQAVGMTGRQLKRMLICEGLCYAVGAALLALLLCLVMNPVAGSLMESMYWFFTARFTIWPVLLMIPIFALLGWLVPIVMYSQVVNRSIVERLRESEN